MDTNSTNETYSTNESQDISSSQQSSEANLSQCGLDEGNSVASSVQESQHDEVVNSAIMEVSGELMLGKLSQQKYPSGGSESSDISDDDSRRLATGGAIVKYPESSTGMSDNDWNPYATESDTNQTPRSAASDELMLASKDPVTTVSMVTGEVFTSKGLDNQPHLGSGTFADEYRVLPRTESESYKPRYREDIPDPMRQNGSDDRSTRLDILRQMIGDDSTEDFLQIEKPFLSDYRAEKPLDIDTPPRDRDDELGKSMESTKSSKSDSDPSQKSQGGFSRESEETLKGRDSTESAKSLELHAPDNNKEPRKSTDSAGSGEHSRRESGESVRSHHSVRDGRHSAESGISDEIRRESTESYRSLPDMGGRSGRQSSETSKSPRSGLQSVESWRSPRSDKSEGSHGSGRESAESQQSPKSDRSRGSDYSGRSQKSHASAGSAAGTDRLDRLNEVGDSVKELMQFEAAQRKLMDGFEREPMSVSKINPRSESPRSNEVSRRVRLTDNFEAYTAPTKTASTLTRSSGAEYVSVTEREKLLSESPGFSELTYHTQKEQAVPFKPELELKGTSQQDMKYTSSRITDAGLRSPSEVSMKRVSDLFEETKKQSRAAVSLPRPDPSGSEERFPLQERLSLSQHVDDSFKTHDRTGHSEKSRDSETARSITSEEVARVLGKHVDTEADLKRRKPEKDKENREPLVKISAFDKVDRNTNAINDALGDIKYDAAHYADMSDDEIAKRVRAILSDTEYLGIVGGNGKTLPRGELQDSDTSEKYVPHTIDYSKLQRDLQEIQDTLHDVPPPKANDSLYHLRKMKEAEADQNQSGTSESGHFKSAETTSTSGRESGISNFGRKLAWDHAADLQYDEGYTGQFYGTMTSTDTDTLIGTQRLRKSGTLESDNLMVRAESTTTNESEPDGPDFPPQDTEAAAQSIVDQVLSRHAEGPLQENVEDIIARYRNERQDLFDKYQPEKEGPTYKIPSLPQQLNQNQSAIQRPLLSQPEPDKLTTHLSSAATSASGPKQNADAQPGLAERVYKILTSDEQPESYRAPPPHLEQGMAKKVYKILSADRPGSQVNGILTDAVEKEHEMLKKLVEQRHAEDDSSLEVPPRLNGTSDSFALSEKDVRRQLEWSLISSPDKTGVSDLSTIRKVTSAPYSSVDNAKTVLSSQLQKMSERNFDKSVELRTPYRQAIDCYPVYGVERDSKKQEPEQKGREAWMPVPNPSRLSPEKVGEKKTDALASERFFLTHKDHSPLRDQGERRTESPQRQRTYSDPFEISPSRRSTERGQHPRSKSQEDTDVSDLSQYSVYDPTDRRAASSSHRLDLRGDEARRKPDDAGFMTPAKHKPQDSGHETISPTESDSSGSKKLSKLRPYRPAGSRDVYYTESGDDTNESGTTIESTHPGSDDAIPPYIPTQYMGSRQDEPAKHPIGIYGTNSKDALSTIDEKSVGDDREKALSVSTTSAKDEPGKKLNRESSAKVRDPDYLLRARSPYNERSREPVSKGRATLSIDSDAGYQTGAVGKSSKEDSSREAAITEKRKDEARLRELEIRRKLETVRNRNIDMGNFYSSASRQETLEGPELKTREEYLRELEAREREILIRAQYSEEKHDPLGTTVRSDPGGSLEDHRDIHDLGVFKRLEPEPLYPQERIRYSRSRSETDLTAMSPVESQKYSSPMQPGTRFMELSSQPSPISHQESLSLRNREPGVSRDPVRQIGRLDDITSRRARSPADHRDHVRELAIDREGIRNRERVELDRETRYPLERRLEMQEYPLELPIVTERRASQDDQPRQSRLYQTQGRTEVERIVDSVSGKDTRKSPHDHLEAKSPLCVREKELERELEEMNREIAAQVKEAQGKAVDEKEEFEDNFPPSKKAQVLREVLEQEYMDNIPPNINDMWSRFKELNSQSDRESSLNSTRLDALSGLLKNPVHHDVNTFLEEKSEEKERRQLEAEQAERVKAERLAIIEREKRLAQEKAAEERILKRKERQQLRLSGEESNGSYSEILYEKEKQEKVKGRHRNKEGLRGSKDKKTRTPDPNKEKGQKKSKKGKENEIKEKVEVKQKYSKSSNSKKEIKNPVVNLKYQHSDSMDTLFSIPEDASFDISPTKAESEMKARQKRQRHVIDPLMKKLRDKIKLQRDKIDKERRKELQRVEKLKKLEMLLTAKRKGKLSDKAIDVELENVSSTTSVSQSEASATLSEATLTAGSTTMESDGSSQGSTTLKDTSSFESPRLQYKKYPEEAFAGHKKVYQESESSASASQSESSDFSNIIVERVPERKPDRRAERRSTEKKSKSKEKKAKVDDSGHKIRKEKKKKEVFGVELSDDALAKQLRRYERYISPERVGKQRDAATMYPSPITVSPPSRRRLRDVYMKSEAIQTSPSVRSTSPCHTYDEVPVAPVPLMGQGRVLGQSPSPARSRSPALPAPRRISKSPVDKSRSRSAGSRKSSRSPSAGTQTDISSPVSKSKTSSRTRSKKAQSPMWKPETPPRNRMFEPETPDENREPFTKTEDPPGALSWFVSLKPSEPWRKPLKERQAFSVSREPWEPKSVSQSTWKNMVHGDVLKDKSDVSNVSRDTKFELDTTGQPIRDEESMSESEESDLEVLQSKPLTKMTLQEAFLQRKQNTLSRLRERQKRLNLAAEERKMQAYLQLERDRLFQEERRKEANPEAHPYSDNLFRPARRVISKEEMKEMTQRKYKKLPEVVEQEKLKKRTEQYGLNRLKARLFNRKVQRHVLVKAQKWGR